jgi:hypothetical protein
VLDESKAEGGKRIPESGKIEGKGLARCADRASRGRTEFDLASGLEAQTASSGQIRGRKDTGVLVGHHEALELDTDRRSGDVVSPSEAALADEGAGITEPQLLDCGWHGSSAVAEAGSNPHRVADRREPDLQVEVVFHEVSFWPGSWPAATHPMPATKLQEPLADARVPSGPRRPRPDVAGAVDVASADQTVPSRGRKMVLPLRDASAVVHARAVLDEAAR